MKGFVQEQGQMELMTGKPRKGLDLPLLSRYATVASMQTEDGHSVPQFAAKLSLYLIHSVSDISYKAGSPIRFLPAFDYAALTRSPP